MSSTGPVIYVRRSYIARRDYHVIYTRYAVFGETAYNSFRVRPPMPDGEGKFTISDRKIAPLSRYNR